MPSYVALLRGINVGGRNLVAMAKLRALVDSLGFSGVATLLQSGNVLFSGPTQTTARIERRLEASLSASLGVEAAVIVRTAREWAALVAANPLATAAQRDPARLHVVALRSAPAAASLAKLRAAHRGPERIEASGRQLYVHYVEGAGRSRLTLPAIEAALGTTGTARNWNTVLKLADLLHAGSPRR